MALVQEDYPALSDLLDGYFHQDWALLAPDMRGVVDLYLAETAPGDAEVLRKDIAVFLARAGDAADAAFRDAYPNSVRPEGWGMDAASWLRLVSEQAAGTTAQAPA